MDSKDSTGSEIESKIQGLQFKLSKGSDTYAKTVKALAEYAGKEFGQEIRLLVSQGKEMTSVLPQLSEKPTRQEELQWSKDYDLVLRKKNEYEKNKGQVFAMILGLCETTMKCKVEAVSAYAKIEEDSDVVNLLKEIKKIAYASSEKQYPAKTAVISIKELLSMHQWDDELLVEYYNRFNDAIERLDRTFGDFYPKVLVDIDKRAKAKPDEKIAEAKEKFMTILFMESCNKGFKPMLRDLERDYSLGAELYPTTRVDALKVLMEYERQPVYVSIMKKIQKRKEAAKEEVNVEGFEFVMSKKEMIKKRLCFRCGKVGHKARDCKEEKCAAQITDDRDPGLCSWMS